MQEPIDFEVLIMQGFFLPCFETCHDNDFFCIMAFTTIMLTINQTIMLTINQMVSGVGLHLPEYCSVFCACGSNFYTIVSP